jgi:CHASE3 domain sensor protein
MEVPAEEPAMESEEAPADDEEIDLDEILREMGYGEEEAEEEAPAAEANEAKVKQLEAELKEAMDAIKSLRGTINEVNLLNAKLLYANKLFRGYNLTNEQKVKVVENLDRTSSVREVKLVYATLSESMKFTGTERKISAKKTVTEGFASKPQASTAPAKEIISESNELANRFKQLAGIIK